MGFGLDYVSYETHPGKWQKNLTTEFENSCIQVRESGDLLILIKGRIAERVSIALIGRRHARLLAKRILQALEET